MLLNFVILVEWEPLTMPELMEELQKKQYIYIIYIKNVVDMVI